MPPVKAIFAVHVYPEHKLAFTGDAARENTVLTCTSYVRWFTGVKLPYYIELLEWVLAQELTVLVQAFKEDTCSG